MSAVSIPDILSGDKPRLFAKEVKIGSY